ncbi:MAG: aminomethyltransferase family protein [Enterocloster clostridioformis]
MSIKLRTTVSFIVVNASNKDKDYQWMKDHVSGDVELEDISDQVGQLALQGPKALDVLKKVTEPDGIPISIIPLRRTAASTEFCIISKTGYTGEDGVEIYMAGKDAPSLWELLLEAGREEGLIPCGLGSQGYLRLEASMPLYGHEMDDTITPKEAGLGIFVKMDKEDFIGKKALQENGTSYQEAGGA